MWIVVLLSSFGENCVFEQFYGLVLLWWRAECRKLCSCWRGQFEVDRMLVAQDIGFLFDGEQVKRFGAGVIYEEFRSFFRGILAVYCSNV